MISVIVPVYNTEDYLEECMSSLLNQTCQELQIILVDDGSTDSSPQICDHYAKIDRRITVIHKKNEGIPATRTAGLKAATGDYIGYVDSDDWIEPDTWMKLYGYAEQYKADIVICGWCEDAGKNCKKISHGFPDGFYDKKALIDKIYPEMMAKGSFYGYGIFASLCGKLFRREILIPNQRLVAPDISMGEDAACTFPCLLQSQTMYLSNEGLYHYRQRTGSTVKQIEDAEKERYRFQILYQSVKKRLEPYEREYQGKAMLQRQWHQFMLSLMVPRADGLYKGFCELDYLFPFPEVKKGARIVLYGAGTWGQRLESYLRKHEEFQVMLWADRNYTELSKMGLRVSSPEKIAETEFDYIVVAVIGSRASSAIKKELSGKYGAERVITLNEELIMSEETLMSFGLI